MSIYATNDFFKELERQLLSKVSKGTYEMTPATKEYKAVVYSGKVISKLKMLGVLREMKKLHSEGGSNEGLR